MIDHSKPADNQRRQPLAVIREKEHLLAEAIRLAKEQAQARMAEARACAAALREQAERDGMQEAEKLYQEGIANTRDQAQTIRLEGEATATKLREHDAARISEAAEYVVQFVLPSIEKN